MCGGQKTVVEMASLLSARESQGLISGCQSWRQAPFPAESSQQSCGSLFSCLWLNTESLPGSKLGFYLFCKALLGRFMDLTTLHYLVVPTVTPLLVQQG